MIASVAACHAARNGHFDAVICLRKKVKDVNDYLHALHAAADSGQLHVIQWLIEHRGNKPPHLLMRETHKRGINAVFLFTGGLLGVNSRITDDLFIRACDNDRVNVVEWLPRTYSPHIKNVPIHILNTKHTRMLDIVSSYFGEANLLECFSKLRDDETIRKWGPVAVQWCMQRGMRFTEADFHNMIMNESRDVAYVIDHLLPLGAVWRELYFQRAVMRNDVAFCKWAHTKGLALTLDQQYIANIDTGSVSRVMLEWFASIGVYLRTDQPGLFAQLRYVDYGAILEYIIRDYPRYALTYLCMMCLCVALYSNTLSNILCFKSACTCVRACVRLIFAFLKRDYFNLHRFDQGAPVQMRSQSR